jgi:hypothetical protein
MKPSSVLMTLLLALVGAGVSFAQTSQPASTDASLGDLARQLKKERAKEFVKLQTVFTNDNLPARPPGEGPTAATGISATAATTEGTPAAATPKTETKTQATALSSGNTEGRGEKYYRRKMKDIQARLSLHQRELSVLEQKFSLGQMEYYSNPQKTLIQESTPALRSDVNKLRSEVDNKKQQIADDEKAINDLQDQLRRDGGDPGWLR